MATYAEQLATVRAAIAAIEGGAQEARVGANGTVYADLATLYAREEKLTGLAAREARGGGLSIGRGGSL